MATDGQKPSVWQWFYKWNYGLGMYGLMMLHRAARYLRRELRPMQAWFKNGFRKLVLSRWRDVRARMQEHSAAVRTVFSAKDVSFLGRIRLFLAQYPLFLRHTGAVVAPLAAVVLLAVTLSYWVSADFGIAVEYEGVPVGCIADETTYHQAADMARARVYSEDGSFEISDTPVMRVKLMREEPLLDTATLCDEILRTKGDTIAEASGLYVDGTFIGSMQPRAALDAVLNDIKKAYCSGAENERAEFIQEVEVVDGLFLSDSVMSTQEMQKRLTAQALAKKEYTVQSGDTLSGIARKLDMTITDLRSMNTGIKNDMIYAGETLIVQRPQPFLRVKVVRTIKYAETIPYGTEKVYNNQKYVTYERVKTAGVNGSQDVTAEVTYIDGVEQNRNILSIQVTKQPVTKVVEVGTKKVITPSGEIQVGDGITTGSMQWPVPICHNMSRGYGYGHYALDICNGPVTVRGKPFVAADGGTVVAASNGWNGGFGNMIRIRHDNGLETVYAHCQSLRVVTGQKVTRGQIIGIIGSTGRSTGPHLHFEVRRNGRRVNPLLYVKP